MQQIFKNIVILGVLLAFLVSAAGFRLVKHTCPMYDISQYSLFTQASCCTTEAPNLIPEPLSCCMVNIDPALCYTNFESTSCCQNESQLIVIEELVAPASFRLEASWVSILPQIFKPGLLLSVSCQPLHQAFRHPPPPVFTGTDYVVYLQQLKLAHC